jgi:hypothetical protein
MRWRTFKPRRHDWQKKPPEEEFGEAKFTRFVDELNIMGRIGPYLYTSDKVSLRSCSEFSYHRRRRAGECIMLVTIITRDNFARLCL